MGTTTGIKWHNCLLLYSDVRQTTDEKEKDSHDKDRDHTQIVGRVFNMKLTDQTLEVIKLIKHFPDPIRLPRWFSRLSMIVSTTLALSTQSLNAQGGITRIAKNTLDLDPVIAFYGAYSELKSQTFARDGDWEYWTKRGAVASREVVHQTFYARTSLRLRIIWPG